MGDLRHMLTVDDVAAYMDVEVDEVRGWVDEGELHTKRTTDGAVLIEREDFLAFLGRQGIPVDRRKFFGLQKPTILIVDDDEDVLKILVQILEGTEKYAVLSAQNATEASYFLAHKRPDLLIVDLMMPDLDGLSLSKLARDCPETDYLRIIVVSGYLDRFPPEEFERIGVRERLSKPVDVEEFRAAVDRVLNS